mgnify:CR=1 FL=1
MKNNFDAYAENVASVAYRTKTVNRNGIIGATVTATMAIALVSIILVLFV